MPHAHRPLPRPALSRSFGAALAVLGLLASGGVAAAPAVKPQAPVATAAPDLSGLKSSHSYTPALGESLERIVAKTMPESPLNATVLSQAFVLLNPQAFSANKPQRTLSTAALKVPNHNQLLQLVLARSPAEASVVRAAEALPSKATPSARAPEKRENWVRYAGGPVKTPASVDGSAPERSTWVHYLGAAFTRSWSGDASGRADARSWVQYPSLGRAPTATATPEASADASKWVQYPSVARATTPATLPDARVDTSGWVRFVANRIYPSQQFAQLFD